jgi:hypothetical protein
MLHILQHPVTGEPAGLAIEPGREPTSPRPRQPLGMKVILPLAEAAPP